MSGSIQGEFRTFVFCQFKSYLDCHCIDTFCVDVELVCLLSRCLTRTLSILNNGFKAFAVYKRMTAYLELEIEPRKWAYQVGAHGTGARLPPVDEQVVSLKLVTPGKGTLDLSAQSDGDLFYLARCGLGVLGVVAEVTLQCVSAHQLLERTFVANIKHVKKNHK